MRSVEYAELKPSRTILCITHASVPGPFDMFTLNGQYSFSYLILGFLAYKSHPIVWYSGSVTRTKRLASSVAMRSPSRKVCHSAMVLLSTTGANLVPSLVYPADMPPSLPLPTLVLQFLKDGLRVIAYGGWAILVAFVWLVFLPLIIKGVWGGLFSGGDSM